MVLWITELAKGLFQFDGPMLSVPKYPSFRVVILCSEHFYVSKQARLIIIYTLELDNLSIFSDSPLSNEQLRAHVIQK